MKSRHFLLTLALLMLVGAAVWSHRENVAAEASQFKPAATRSLTLSSGTEIEAKITNRITSFPESGDIVTAVVSTPVAHADTLTIPAGAILKGNISDIPKTKAAVEDERVWIKFSTLVIGDRTLAIRANPILASIPVQSDFEVAGRALRTLLGATVGAAIGAASGDVEMVNRGMMEGTASATPADSAVPVTVTLSADVQP